MKTNWPTKNLEDIVEFQNGLWTGKKAPFVAAPILRNTNFKNGDGLLNYDDVAEIEVEKKQLEKRTLSKGDILLERSGGGPTQPVGRVVYFEGENNRFGFSNFTTRIRVKGSDVDSKYLWFFLHSFYKSGKTELMQKKTTGIRNLTFSEYKQIEIPLPPLEVQKKIVTKLESLLAKISEAKKLRAEAQESASNLLSAEIHKVFEEGKKKGWEEKNIGDPSIMKMTSGGTPRKSHPEYYGEEIKWLKSGELEDNENITSSEDHITQEGLKKSSAKLFPPQTVLLAMYGATAGKLGILGVEASTNQAVAGMICKPEKLHHKFLFYSLMRIRDEIIANAWGGAQPNLSQTIIKRFSVVLPSISEQKKIVDHLDSIAQKVQEVKELQNTTENEFQTLEQSILSKAFSGKLTL